MGNEGYPVEINHRAHVRAPNTSVPLVPQFAKSPRMLEPPRAPSHVNIQSDAGQPDINDQGVSSPARESVFEEEQEGRPVHSVMPAEEFYSNEGLTIADRNRLLSQATLALRHTRGTQDGMQRMPFNPLPDGAFDSTYKIKSRLENETKIKSVSYDVCQKGCFGFTGTMRKWEKEHVCSVCGLSRQKKSILKFEYLSPIPRLRAMYANSYYSKKLAYRTTRTAETTKIQDVFDGQHFKALLGRRVTWGGTHLDTNTHRYFDQSTDIALHLSTDGISLHNRTGLNAWPLILTIYSLRPEMRYRREHQICCGVIPGAKGTKNVSLDLDSFLAPLLEDLRLLATQGVPTRLFDPSTSGLSTETFTLRAHLITIGGDMPAIAKLMKFKGHNAIHPCRFCNMSAIPRQKGKQRTYYLARKKRDCPGNPDYAKLPLRTHAQTLRRATEIENSSGSHLDDLAMRYGINAKTALFNVDSLDFPRSFPIDIMHVLFENIAPQLIDLWKGKYKVGQILGDVKGRLKEDYVISTADWEAIREEIAASNKSTPSQSVPAVGNIDNKTYWTAETYSYFLMFLGPVVLKGRLRTKYYNHFLLLSEITKKLTQMEFVSRELDEIHSDIVKWVQGFERLYYRFDVKYLSFCTAPIHALLHAVACIKWQGPLCCYWCFSLERFGGWIKSFSSRNKKDVMSWISNELVYREQMLQLSLTMNRAAVREIEKWEDYMNGRPAQFRVWHSRDQPDEPDVSPASTREAAPSSWRPTETLFDALSLHLQTRIYEGDVVPAGRIYEPDPIRLRSIPLTAWRAYTSSSDAGGQRYRAAGLPRSNENVQTARDATWVSYTQFIYKRKTGEQPVGFRKEQQWGRIEYFLEFVWEQEPMRVAVIQSHKVRPWIPHIPEAPQEVVSVDDGAQGGLQVVDLSAMMRC